MRLILVLLSITMVFLLSQGKPVGASTPTPSPKETEGSSLNEQINNLKERIASRVAQLKLVEKRGIIGTVEERSDTKMSIIDIHGTIRYIDVDELTKFTSSSNKEQFDISDVKKGMKLGVLGLYNKQSKRLLARFVRTVDLPTILLGAVKEIDPANFNFSLLTNDSKEYVVEVERTTKTSSYGQEKGMQKSGFSKLKIGERVLAVGYLVKDKDNTYSGDRIIHFLDIPPSKQTQGAGAQDEK